MDECRTEEEQIIGKRSGHGHFGGEGKNEELQAEDTGLTLRVEARNAEERERLEQVVASHFERFAWQEALTLDWQPQA